MDVSTGKPQKVGAYGKMILVLSGLLALYELLIASRLLTWFGFFLPAVQHRAITLFVVIFIIYSLRSASGKVREGTIPWYDLVPVVLGMICAGFVAFNYDAVIDYSTYGYLDTKGIMLAVCLALVLLESARRLTGWALPLIILFFMAITYFQNYLPGILHGKGYALDRLGDSIYVGTGGIFGVPFGVAAGVLITYIIFGKLMQEAGASLWFINLAMSVAGWTRGGVAKSTVVASGLFGMITGSPSTEVATIGSMSIPMMISSGYKPKFAAAVEAVAGTGGQFMPPVMGAIAFIMAEWLGLPYGEIAVAAFIPACLYFTVLFMSIHFEAHRLGLKGTPRSELPSLWSAFIGGWYYIIPIAVLIYFLIFLKYPPEMSGLFSVISLIPLSFLSRDTKNHLTLHKIWSSLTGSVKTWITVAGVTAAVGMLIGSLELSGLGIKFSGFIVNLTQGNLLGTMILIGVASFILGMGLDSIPSYMTLAILAAPALIELGVPPLVAHLYVIYWGLSSFFTPPVCIAIYVACGISGTKIWETGWEAVRIGIAVFIVPLAFVYNQALLAQGSAEEIISAIVTALLGSTAVAAAVRGYFMNILPLWGKVSAFVGGCILIGPTNIWTVIIGLGISLIGVFGHSVIGKKFSVKPSSAE
ncbi:MAG: TRAP transporter [Deltaproteobacteria bacterium RBG_13_53_10]|nr:MAG: TRAP transporter [Deltaproteobacteria bacterium RBG_13_53_10]